MTLWVYFLEKKQLCFKKYLYKALYTETELNPFYHSPHVQNMSPRYIYINDTITIYQAEIQQTYCLFTFHLIRKSKTLSKIISVSSVQSSSRTCYVPLAQPLSTTQFEPHPGMCDPCWSTLLDINFIKHQFSRKTNYCLTKF